MFKTYFAELRFSPTPSAEEWKKVEKSLTVSLGVQGHLTLPEISHSILGNISLE